VCSLEERRKVKGAAYYERKKAVRRQMAEAKKTANVNSETKEELASLGY
jgi:large subunit ribosomal protein L13Ae